MLRETYFLQHNKNTQSLSSIAGKKITWPISYISLSVCMCVHAFFQLSPYLQCIFLAILLMAIEELSAFQVLALHSNFLDYRTKPDTKQMLPNAGN